MGRIHLVTIDCVSTHYRCRLRNHYQLFLAACRWGGGGEAAGVGDNCAFYCLDRAPSTDLWHFDRRIYRIETKGNYNENKHLVRCKVPRTVRAH